MMADEPVMMLAKAGFRTWHLVERMEPAWGITYRTTECGGFDIPTDGTEFVDSVHDLERVCPVCVCAFLARYNAMPHVLGDGSPPVRSLALRQMIAGAASIDPDEVK
jgi:hypothetical protein